MAQKSNPILLRLEKTNQHFQHCWYGDYNYTTQFLENCRISAYIQNIYQQAKAGAPVILLKRVRGQVELALFLSQQRNIGGPGVKRFKPLHTPGNRKEEMQGRLALRSMCYWQKNQKRFTGPGGVLQSCQEQVFQSVLHSIMASGGTHLLPIGDAYPLVMNQVLQQKKTGCTGQARQAAHLRNKFNQDGLPIPWEIYRYFHVSFLYALSFCPGSYAALSLPGTTPATVVKNHVENSICVQLGTRCKIYLLKCPSAHQNPFFVAELIVRSLQERIPFRRLKHRLIQEISRNRVIKGVRITCSGRVTARSKKAQKARKDSIQWGQTSLHIFSELVHFASSSANTTFGKIGVKVWICYRG